MANMVVARFADGRTVKGNSLDVDPNRPRRHVRTAEGEMVDVALDDLKALFFVKSLVPVDTASNNVRILVNERHIASMAPLPVPPPA